MQTGLPDWESLVKTVLVGNDILTREVHLYARGTDPRTRRRYAPGSLSVSAEDDGGLRDATPTIRLSYEEAQALAEALWSCNIRPLAAEASTKEVQALKDNLADLRRYLDHHLGLPPR